MQIGGGEHTYKWIDNWVTLPDTELGRKDKAHHGIVITAAGHIMVFHEGGPALLAYDADGVLQGEWESELTNAHGMTLVQENGAEYIWMADNKSGQVVKSSLEGKTVMSLERPDLPVYRDGTYAPTWVAVNEERHGGNGDVWVTDGYGESYIHRYDRAGRYIATISGEEGAAGRFAQPHGIWLGNRPSGRELYISDRKNNRVQVYDTEGNFKRVFGSDFLNDTSPSGFFSLGEQMLVVELRARITVIGGDDGLVRYLGDNSGVTKFDNWPDVTRDLIEAGRFNSPHSAAADSEGNLYVSEFITGGRITKLVKA